jgi:hypothetical protein
MTAFAGLWTAGPLRFASVCLAVPIVVLMLGGAAVAQSRPDTSDWRTFQAEEYALSIKVPPDWNLDRTTMQQRGDLLDFRAPQNSDDPPAVCGIKVYSNPSGEPIDFDGYLKHVNDEQRFLKALRTNFGNPEIHLQRIVSLPSRRAYHAVFTGDMPNHRWTVVNFDTVEAANLFKLQCVVMPDRFEEHYPIFLSIGYSLRIGPT